MVPGDKPCKTLVSNHQDDDAGTLTGDVTLPSFVVAPQENQNVVCLLNGNTFARITALVAVTLTGASVSTAGAAPSVRPAGMKAAARTKH